MTSLDSKKFENDSVLTSQEVHVLIAEGLAKNQEVVLQIGERRRKISFIGNLQAEGPPKSPLWRIEVE